MKWTRKPIQGDVSEYKIKGKWNLTKLESLAAIKLDEFYIKKIIGHSGMGKNPKKWKFRVRWLGYEPEDDTMLDWVAIKDLAALDEYSNPI